MLVLPELSKQVTDIRGKMIIAGLEQLLHMGGRAAINDELALGIASGCKRLADFIENGNSDIKTGIAGVFKP